MPILEKKELVNYLKYKHKEIFGKNISPIKLQKGLYFLFAIWGGTIKEGQNTETEITDILKDIDFNLFEASFEAWSYGPVDRFVYSEYKINKEFDEKAAIEFFDNITVDYVQEYLDSTIAKIFNSSDFGLVDLSHQDRCWKEAYKPTNGICENKINSNEIIEEYEKKRA